MFPSYFTERFPIIQLFIYTTLTGFAVVGKQSPDILTSIIISVLYLQFLFHLRVLDEFKDYHYDAIHHSERPLHQGTISPSVLKNWGLLNGIGIVVIGLLFAPHSTGLLLVTIFYSGLMYFEFFLKDLLRKRVTFYLISHEIVFIPLFLFFFSLARQTVWFPRTVAETAGMFSLILPIILIEIGRKMKHRTDTNGTYTNDTYAYVWGEQKSLTIFAALVMAVGVLGFSIRDYNYIAATFFIGSGILMAIAGPKYQRQIIRNNMVVTTLFALAAPLALLL